MTDPTRAVFAYVDRETHEPCPTRGGLLCALAHADPNHRHIAAHMVPTRADVDQPALTAERTTDMHALANVIGSANPRTGHVYIDGNDACGLAAEAVLDSDWLAARDADLRARLADPALVEAAQAGIADRLRWASMHWGTEDVHGDAWPHVAKAATDAVTAALSGEAGR